MLPSPACRRADTAVTPLPSRRDSVAPDAATRGRGSRVWLAIATAAVALLLAGGSVLADPGGGLGLQSATVDCTPLGVVHGQAPPATAITPVAFMDGHVYLTQTETITGPRGNLTQTYPIPTNGRPTVDCIVTFNVPGGVLTISWTAVQVN